MPNSPNTRRKAARLAGLVFAVALVSPGMAEAGIAEGQALALQWCAACHVVAPEQTSALEGVPTFATIAKTRDEAAIRAFLFDPHPPMPDFSLTERQLDDIVDYIQTQDD